MAIVLGAWGWYRGTLYWRTTSERARLEALGEVVPPEQWQQWAQPDPDRPVWWGGWRFLIGEADIQRMRALTQRLDEIEGASAAPDAPNPPE